MLVAISKGVVRIQDTTVSIGCKHNGSQVFIDTTNGVYWEALPALNKDAEKLQIAMLPKLK